MNKCIPEQLKPEYPGDNDKTEDLLLQTHYERAVFLGKNNNAKKNIRLQEKRKPKYKMD